MRIRIEGGEQLADVARSLRSSEHIVPKVAASKLRTVTPRIRNKFRARALATMPSSGGLAALIASSSITGTPHVTGSGAEVTVRASMAGADLGQIDAGTVWHLVYGHGPARRQSVPAGVFTKAAEPEAEKALEQAADAALEALAREIF